MSTEITNFPATGTQTFWVVDSVDVEYELEAAFRAARKELGCEPDLDVLFSSLQGALEHASRVLGIYAQNSSPLISIPPSLGKALKQELGLDLWAAPPVCEYRASKKAPVIETSSNSCTLKREVEVRAFTKKLLSVEVAGEVYTREGRVYTEWVSAGEAQHSLHCETRQISFST